MKTGKARYVVLICCVVLTFVACGPRGYVYHGGGKFPRKKFLADQQHYQPYLKQDTLEAYREFIRKYPSNAFRSDARDKMDLLEFKPYETLNTVEGYLEFKMLYPRNKNVKKANWHIEQVEIRRYDNLDTIAGYREFIDKYPNSIFVNSAHERLQELSFRDQDRKLRNKYGFDLLKYRYAVRKLSDSYEPLWNFTLFACIDTRNGKPVFVNRLLYSTLPNLQDETIRKQLQETVVSRLLDMIASQRSRAARLPQPLFEICHAPGGINAQAVPRLVYSTQPGALRQLASGRKKPVELVTMAHAMPAPVPTASAPQHAPGTTERTSTHTRGISQAGKAAKTVARPPSGPVEIMRHVANINAFTDAVLSRRWETHYDDGRTYEVSTIEKHMRYEARNALRSAMVLRYLDTSQTRDEKKKCAAAILLQRSHKGKERYWYIMHRGDPGRAPNIGTYRSEAENNFFLELYVDPPVESETHTLLATTTYRNRPAAIIKSTPREKNSYFAWRKSTIDRERMVPLIIEYYNGQGTPIKNVAFTWVQRFGLWYWDTARFQNLEDGSTTRIETTDIRINIGLHERDFQPSGLARLTGR